MRSRTSVRVSTSAINAPGPLGSPGSVGPLGALGPLADGSTAPADTTARDRVRRVLWVSLSIAAIVYSALGWSKAESQMSVLEPWWGWTAYVVDTVCPIALGVLALLLRPRVITIVALAYAMAFLVTMATWRAVMTTTHDPSNLSPWTNDVVTIAVVAVAIVVRPRWAWTYAVVATLLVGLVRFLADPELGVLLALMDLLYASLTNVVFTGLTLLTRAGAADLDRIAALAGVEAAKEAAASARLRERARIDALTHDHVLSTLFIASRADAASRQRLQEVAASVLEVLADEPGDGGGTVPGTDFVSTLRAAVTGQSDGVEFRVDAGDPGGIPVEVTRALLEATTEALRNSLQHAGRDDAPVERIITVTMATGSVRIAVADDGPGFDLRRVPVERLGVRVSIVGRMTTLPGGHAVVITAAGSGTRVEFGWRAP